VPWPHCPNKNVFSNRLNWLYDSPHSLRLVVRLFQTCGPVAPKVLSPKLLRDRITTSVRVSAEHSKLQVTNLPTQSRLWPISTMLMWPSLPMSWTVPASSDEAFDRDQNFKVFKVFVKHQHSTAGARYWYSNFVGLSVAFRYSTEMF